MRTAGGPQIHAPPELLHDEEHRIRRIVVLNAYFASLSIADAADSGASAPSGQPPAPPPEAVAACQGKAAGTTVSFTGRRGDTLTGTCETRNGVLAARPNFGGGKPPSRH